MRHFEALGETCQLSAYLVVTGVLEARGTAGPSRIVYATRTGTSILLAERLWQALVDGAVAQVAERHLVRLRQIEVIVPAGQDEFAEILQRNVEGVAASTRLSVTIQPSANCQLDCGYCGQVHQKRNVDAAVGVQMTDRIIDNLDRHGYRRLSVQWYGAEPLMAYSEIIRMSERLRAHCARRGIDYGARMITNGMSFKPAVFLGLLAQGVGHYQITLDGLAQTHDVMRISKEGRKSFDIIFSNIVAVTSLPEYLASDCTITIRINVNRQSAATVAGLIERLASFELGARRVALDFAPIVDWGGNQAAQGSLTKEEFGAAEIDWMLHAVKNGFELKRVIPARRHGPCMVVEKDAEVYDASGNVYPCYEYPYTPKYEGPQYRIGHLDTLALRRNDAALPKNWLEDVKTDIAPCKRCNLFPVCGGACPKQWHDRQIACPSYKANMAQRLVLDYLIKQPGYLHAYLNNAAPVFPSLQQSGSTA